MQGFYRRRLTRKFPGTESANRGQQFRWGGAIIIRPEFPGTRKFPMRPLPHFVFIAFSLGLLAAVRTSAGAAADYRDKPPAQPAAGTHLPVTPVRPAGFAVVNFTELA